MLKIVILLFLLISISCSSNRELIIKLNKTNNSQSRRVKVFLNPQIRDSIKINPDLLFNMNCFKVQKKNSEFYSFRIFKKLERPYFIIENQLGELRKVSEDFFKNNEIRFPINFHCIEDENTYFIKNGKIKILDLKAVTIKNDDKKIRIYYVSRSIILESNWMKI